MKKQGQHVIDYWSRETLLPDGQPRVWIDAVPQVGPRWRSYPTYLRSATEGMEGMLVAWQFSRERGEEQRHWLLACRRFGNWLLEVQGDDGSFQRAFRFEGAAGKPEKNLTFAAIRYLAWLHVATAVQSLESF
jgi:hypothetical protein